MKRFLIYTIIAAAAVCAASTRVQAQMKSSYFMEGSIPRLDMNAAFVPQRGYVNIPVVGNLGFGLNSNYLSVKNFLYPNPEGSGLVTFMHGSVDASDFLSRIRNRNHLNFSVRDNIFGFGAFAKRYFWSFGLNLRSETSMTIPKEFFEMAKRFNEGTYDLGGFNLESDNYLEFAVGFAFPVRILEKRVDVGFRAKGLLGAAHASMNIESMRASIDGTEWRADMQGTFTGNITAMDFSRLHGQMNLADVFDPENREFSMKRIGSWGLAFDLGAETRFLDDRLKVSLGVNDIGFVSWSKKSAVTGTFDNLSVSYRGYNFDAKKGEDDIYFDSPDSVMVTIGTPKASTRMLTATLNVGAEYNILHEAIGFGLLSQTRFYSDYTSTELTVSANFRPSRWFTGTLSHTLVQNRLGVFGVALNVHPSWINLFLGMDYVGLRYAKSRDSSLMLPLGMKSLNFYFGLAVPLSKPKACGRFPDRTKRCR